MHQKRFYHSFIIVVYVVTIGIALSAILAWRSAHWIEETEREHFNDASQQIVLLIKSALQKDVQLLQSLAAFLMSSSDVDRAEWKLFLSRHPQKDLPGVELFAYAPRIKTDQKENFEALMQNNGYSTYRVFPEVKQPYCCPMIYIEPLTPTNEKALGFDIASEEVRRLALETAIKTGNPTISSKIALVMEKTHEKDGYVIYVPVYDALMPLTTETERVLASKGVVIAALQVKEFFAGLLGMQYIGVDFELYEGTSITLSNKVYDSHPSLKEARLSKHLTFDLYGRQWTMVFKADNMLALGFSRYIPWVELIIGIILSLLLGSILLTLQRTRQDALRLAEKMTFQFSRSEAKVQSIFQAMNEGVLVLDGHGKIIRCNAAAQHLLQLSEEEILGNTVEYGQWQAIYENGTPFLYEERPTVKVYTSEQPQKNMIVGIKRKNNTVIWTQINAQPIFDEDHRLESVVTTMSDITAYRQSKYKLERYVDMIDRYVIVSTTDLEGIIVEVSMAFCKISGYSKEELIGKSHNIVRHPDMETSVYQEMWQCLQANRTWEGEMKNRHKNGSTYWVKAIIAPFYNEQGTKIGYTAVREDITDKKHIEELSVTDRLTGLFNRVKSDEFFTQLMAMQKRYHHPCAIVFVDIDKFKSINDTYGHQVGDSVLRELAVCLKSHIRDVDIASRWGGEEFLLFFPETDLKDAMQLAEKLRATVEEAPFSTVGHITVSCGVACCHEDDTQESIVERADQALYQAKNAGRNRVMTLEKTL